MGNLIEAAEPRAVRNERWRADRAAGLSLRRIALRDGVDPSTILRATKTQAGRKPVPAAHPRTQPDIDILELRARVARGERATAIAKEMLGSVHNRFQIRAAMRRHGITAPTSWGAGARPLDPVRQLHDSIADMRPGEAVQFLSDLVEYLIGCEQPGDEACPADLNGRLRQLYLILARRAPAVAHRDAIHACLCAGLAEDEQPDIKMVDVLICKLRKVLAETAPHLRIETAWGDGYRLIDTGAATIGTPAR